MYQGSALTKLRYTITLVPVPRALTCCACASSRSWQSIGFWFAQSALPFDQSKSTMPHPTVESGSVSPDSLQGIMIVDRFMSHVTGYGQTDGMPFWADTEERSRMGRRRRTI